MTIRQARRSADMTQAQLASRLGISRGTYARIEERPGRATLNQICLIAEATDTSAWEIFQSERCGLDGWRKKKANTQNISHRTAECKQGKRRTA